MRKLFVILLVMVLCVSFAGLSMAAKKAPATSEGERIIPKKVEVDTNGDGVSDTGLAGGQGNQLGGIPEWIYRTELLYQWVDGYYAGPTLEWVPEDWAVDHANTLFADRYQVLNFKWGQRLKTGLSWYIEWRNLSAETYAATTGVILNANGSDQAQFLPGDGRSIYVGVDYQVQ